ncbi:MAG: YncE family protein [Brevundimonas sp.]|nr:YncE family protein [Brevundimonas sp.]
MNRILAVSAAVLLGTSALISSPALAQTAVAFPAPAREFDGQVSFASAEQGRPVLPGGEVVATGRGFAPGQTVRILHGATPLVADQTASAEGGFQARFRLPADAATGIHALVVTSPSPYGAAVAELKVSPDVPVSGADRYTILRGEASRGLYQSAYSARNDALFVTSAVGRPPVRQSELLRLDADTLAIEARLTPAAAPGRRNAAGEVSDGGVYAVYGVGVDDAHDTVWVTQSRQNTVAVYRQSDLSLVRQFEPGTVSHARDVVIDAAQNKAYASATFEPEVVVFNTANPDVASRITIASTVRGQRFSAASLSMDATAHRLYVVSNSTNEVAVIDTRTDAVLNVFAVPGARSAIGVSHDPQTDRIFVAAQGSDNVVILNGETGAVIADTPVGAGALNVVFDTASRQAFVANRGSSTIAVIDVDGRLVANIDGAPQANHVSTDGQGVIYAVTKGGEQDNANTVWRIQPRR